MNPNRRLAAAAAFAAFTFGATLAAPGTNGRLELVGGEYLGELATWNPRVPCEVGR